LIQNKHILTHNIDPKITKSALMQEALSYVSESFLTCL